MDSGNEDPGQRFAPFRHVTGDLAPRYRAVMAAFVGAKERFVVHLRPEDVLDVVPPGTADLDPDTAKAHQQLRDLATCSTASLRTARRS